MSVVSLEGHRLISSWNYQVSPVLTDDVSLFNFEGMVKKCRYRYQDVKRARRGGGGGVLLIHPCLFLFSVLATGAVVTAF